MRYRAAVFAALLLLLLALASTACGDGTKNAVSTEGIAMTDYLQEVESRFYWLSAEKSKEPQVFGSMKLEQQDLCRRTRPMYAFNVRLFRELTNELRVIAAPPGSGHAKLIEYAKLARQTYSNALKETESAMRRTKDPSSRGDAALAIQDSFNYDMEYVVTPQYLDWLATAVTRATNVGAFVPAAIQADADNYDVMDR